MAAFPSTYDPFTEYLLRREVLTDEKFDVELGMKDGTLDYMYFGIGKFPGQFVAHGASVELSATTEEADVLERFGEPYWRDDDKDETILFYEDGTVELQFEFPGKVHLGIITIMLSPILASAEQRQLYGVDKPWPPPA